MIIWNMLISVSFATRHWRMMWCIELAYGNFVKQEVAMALGITVEHINKNKEKFRTILQWWGTEWRRMEDKDYWIRKLESKLGEIMRDGKVEVVIITDVRFLNEYKYINTIGGVLVRVTRPGTYDDNHQSEIELDKIAKWHSIIINNGTEEDLVPQVKELLAVAKIN